MSTPIVQTMSGAVQETVELPITDPVPNERRAWDGAR
jgi:hypothetical protein